MLYQLSYTHRKKTWINYQNRIIFSIGFLTPDTVLIKILTYESALTIIWGVVKPQKKYETASNIQHLRTAGNMNTLLIFVVRLILGLVFGIILTRLFNPDWGIFGGVVVGFLLVALSYGMAYLRTRNN